MNWEKGDRTLFELQTLSTFIVCPVNNTPPLFSLPRPSPPPSSVFFLLRWSPPRASEGQSAHVSSAGPGNSDVMAHIPFHVSAVNRLAASVRLKPRRSPNPRVSILILEIAILVLTLCWRYSESTSIPSGYPHPSCSTIETWVSQAHRNKAAARNRRD